ncbi:MAG TPA: 5-formyltetrahydrofolate cyclo-ligase [Steroidobacteraceae bacterium]|nr:5-formyltetrahydrofolate cyclo-ligase [Steroidobacteraceae bacterium]
MKAALRKQLRGQRCSLSASQHRHRSRAAAKAIMRLRSFRTGCRVALYLPFDRELDTDALVAAARRRGVRLFVPVISDRRHCRLRFYPLTGDTDPGTFGISVPRRRLTPISAQWLDLIVIPLVGVDGEGRRLGMGGGYYDRALAFRRRRRCWKGPHLVGLAFDCQRTSVKFADAWDVRLDSLATESGMEHYL